MRGRGLLLCIILCNLVNMIPVLDRRRLLLRTRLVAFIIVMFSVCRDARRILEHRLLLMRMIWRLLTRLSLVITIGRLCRRFMRLRSMVRLRLLIQMGRMIDCCVRLGFGILILLDWLLMLSVLSRVGVAWGLDVVERLLRPSSYRRLVRWGLWRLRFGLIRHLRCRLGN